jgi:hypothetical protein
VFPTEDEIAQRAFELFFYERDPDRSLNDYWRWAERELLDRAACQALRPTLRDLPPPRPRHNRT